MSGPSGLLGEERRELTEAGEQGRREGKVKREEEGVRREEEREGRRREREEGEPTTLHQYAQGLYFVQK